MSYERHLCRWQDAEGGELSGQSGHHSVPMMSGRRSGVEEIDPVVRPISGSGRFDGIENSARVCVIHGIPAFQSVNV